MNFLDSPIAKKAVAKAIVIDTWAGELTAILIPQRTKRNGQSVIVYRWLDARGFCCDGLRCGFSAERMVNIATHNPKFSNVCWS